MYHTQTNDVGKVHSRKINSNLELVHKTHNPDQPRPLVLLYAWMAAKERHKQKYSDYYLNRGFDVFHVDVSPTQLLRPTKVQKLSETISDVLMSDHVLSERPILVHTFSVGAYAYGENLVLFQSRPDEYKPLTDRIKGHVYDSPVGRQGIGEGLPKALTKNELIVKSSNAVLSWYLNTFKESVTKHYDFATDISLRNELGIPALFLYSKADPVGRADIIDDVFIAGMKAQKNAEIFAHCWLDSPHVSHMHKYPQEYVDLLDRFLESIGMLGQSENDEKAEKVEMKI